MPSAAALDLNASRSALSFDLSVPFEAGGLASSTNQLVAVSLADPPIRPDAEAPSPASAGATASPATNSADSASRRLLLSILAPSHVSFDVRRLSERPQLPRARSVPRTVSDIEADVKENLSTSGPQICANLRAEVDRAGGCPAPV